MTHSRRDGLRRSCLEPKKKKKTESADADHLLTAAGFAEQASTQTDMQKERERYPSGTETPPSEKAAMPRVHVARHRVAHALTPSPRSLEDREPVVWCSSDADRDNGTSRTSSAAAATHGDTQNSNTTKEATNGKETAGVTRAVLTLTSPQHASQLDAPTTARVQPCTAPANGAAGEEAATRKEGGLVSDGIVTRCAVTRQLMPSWNDSTDSTAGLCDRKCGSGNQNKVPHRNT